MNLKIGIGTDIHKLKNGIPLIIGGTKIPFEKGASGHSDGDVLIHALCDAILGAAAMRDIGYHFSDKDPENKNADSRLFLVKVVEMVKEEGYDIINVDATIQLEKPKLSPYIDAIRESLATILKIPAANVSVKAKTAEGTGSVGMGKTIEAVAISLLCKE